MKSIWKWSIAPACILAALVLIAGIWLAAKPDVTPHGGSAPTLSPLPKASQDDVATATALRPPSSPPTSAPTIIAAAPAVETAPPTTSPAAARSARRMEDLAKAIEDLPKGNIVLHAPNAMTVAEKRNVEASVGVNVPMEILRKQVDSRDRAVEGTLRVSSEMAATLNGAGFKIEAVTPEQQAIAEGFPTVWSWNVEAQQEGEQVLEATLYALVPDGATSSRLRVESYFQKITVSVRPQTWGEWLEALSHEIDAVKAILAALVGAATAVFGWFGISLARQKGKTAAKSGRRRKSPA